MDKAYGQYYITSPKHETYFWRRVELTDLPKLKKMMTNRRKKSCEVLSDSSDIARIITDNPLSLCQVNSDQVISIFVSLSDRPNIASVAYEHWTEWFNYFYDLADVEEYNTLFVHVLLYRCVESFIYLPKLFETIYIQMPEIKNVILIKAPGMKLGAELCSQFFTLPAKNVTPDPYFGRPEVLYHTRASSINKIRLRTAIVDDFIDLRANLGARLEFLDTFYGEYSLAKILEFPGEGRVNLVSVGEVNGLMIINTSVDYSMLASVFDLIEYGVLVVKDDETKPKKITQLPDIVDKKIENSEIENNSIDSMKNVQNELISLNSSKKFNDKNEDIKYISSKNTLKDDDDSNIFVKSESMIISKISRDFSYEDSCNEFSYIINDFLKFQSKPSQKSNTSSLYLSNFLDKPALNTTLNYKNTSFMIELMLVNEEEEIKASRDFLVAYFHNFPQYDYCLVTLSTITTAPEFKKYFCKVSLKSNHHLGQLYVLHRSCIFGKFTCIMVTEDHLEIMEYLIENHPFKQVVSNNISKSVFEDARYKTYIFLCNDQPIGYCVIRLCDEITFLSTNFEVARYVFLESARNHTADLLNMDIQSIFLKRARDLLKYVMEDSDINCLFYKIYSDSAIMKQHGLSYISGMEELIPVKPRIRVQYDDTDESSKNAEQFALFHMNTRLCTNQKWSIDAKIVVVGASVVALSFLENLLFNPVNYYVSFENVVLISDCGLPYRVSLTDLEDSMIPKVSHYNHEYIKAMGLNVFANVITGTVTAINRADKYVSVNGNDSIYYDYLFFFNGEQFSIENKQINPEKQKKSSNCGRQNSENVLPTNLFLLNSDCEVIHACNYIEVMRESDKDIIVFGKYLGSLSVINVLLESNITGSRIVYVESENRKNLPFIPSKLIEKAVYDELRQQGVRVYKQFKFEKMTLNDSQMSIQQVTFSSDVEWLTLNCAGLFWFDQKLISKVNMFTMIQSSFDFTSHLAVNASFETNVECVYAAGPVAEFTDREDGGPKRRTHHARYSSSEIGARAANVLMRRLRVLEDDQEPAEYVRPLSVRCRLPGGFDYLRAVVPFAEETLTTTTTTTTTLSTGSVARRYFEMVVDDRGDVLALSCYSNAAFKYSNLINLCGKNVNLFNDMMDRLSKNSIPCFYDYFDEPWAYPLYSDRFWKLLDDVVMQEVKKNDKDIEKFLGNDVEDLMSQVNTVSELSCVAGLDRRFEQVYAEKLQKVLVDFIDDNIDDFSEFSFVRDAVDRTNSV